MLRQPFTVALTVLEDVVRNEEEKSVIELEVFLEFVSLKDMGFIAGSERKGNADIREPDIFCKLDEGVVYFELAEVCAPEFASAITEAVKTGKVEAVWGGDVSEKTLRKKISKKYDVTEPIELLLYTAGRSVLSDESIEEKLLPMLFNGFGQFRKVWLLGENGVRLLASNS
jgi:hypothetical protein